MIREDLWKEDSQCRRAPELFFDDENKRWLDKMKAVSYCNLCPNQDLCADELIFTESEFGIWSGAIAGDVHEAMAPLLADTRPWEDWGDVASDVADLLANA